MFGMEAQAMKETRCMQDWAVTLQTEQVKAKNNTDTPSSPLLCFLCPLLEAKIENNAVFEDGDEQHDGEPSQHAQVL